MRSRFYLNGAAIKGYFFDSFYEFNFGEEALYTFYQAYIAFQF